MFGLLLELNRGVPNGTLRGVRGRGNPPYSIFSHIYANKSKAPKGLVLALQMLVIFVVFLKFTAGTCQVSDFLDYAVKSICHLGIRSAVVHLLAVAS